MASPFAHALRIIIRAMTVVPALVVAGMIASCASSRSAAPEREPPPFVTGEPIAPNHCRVVGTILEMQEPDAGATGSGPCSRYPCVAKVRVDSVLGYGSAFPGALAPGQAIQVRFQFTLAPSSEVFPNETFSLPGLTPGDRFAADVSGFEEMMAPAAHGGAEHYGVALYRKLQ